MGSAHAFAVIGRLTTAAIIFLLPAVAQESQPLFYQPFQEGCCLNRSFPRPKQVSHVTVSATRLREALNCAANNRFVGGTRQLAKALGDEKSLSVSYYYGKYMPEQDGAALTIAVYSVDGKHGILFDVDWEAGKYAVDNLPPLLKAPKQWRVGEINGGLWSYSRLWYLAQELGSRPRVSTTVEEIERRKPKGCWVFFDDETNWKPGTEKFVGDSVRQAMPPKKDK